MLSNRRAFHSVASADLRISDGEEGQYLSKIKEEIRLQVERGGSKVVGEGAGEGSYYCEYTDGNLNGWIDIVGSRGSGDAYRVVIIVSEN